MAMTIGPAPKPKKKGPKPEINVTPLVDVVLVLLIIFMVVTPQLEAGESVELPQIFFPDPKGKGKLDPLTITYTMSGRYFVEKDSLPNEEAFKARLTAEHAAHPERRVLLKGDSRQQFGKMREVFALVQSVGFGGVSLVVGDKPRRAGDPAPLLAQD